MSKHLKSVFIIIYFILIAMITLYGAILISNSFSWAWIGVLLTTLPSLLLFAIVYITLSPPHDNKHQ
ncbi:MAG: hypothetical protein MJA83_09505, partial [Gammaproteobacteria bacterium]|nr:hypothetical protein [Gammaproteobacteria bacterium]